MSNPSNERNQKGQAQRQRERERPRAERRLAVRRWLTLLKPAIAITATGALVALLIFPPAYVFVLLAWLSVTAFLAAGLRDRSSDSDELIQHPVDWAGPLLLLSACLVPLFEMPPQVDPELLFIVLGLAGALSAWLGVHIRRRARLSR